MMIPYFKWAFAIVGYMLIGIAGIQGQMITVCAAAGTDDISPSLSSQDPASTQTSWLDAIDAYWGGRLKTTGTVSWATEDTFFEPVGTGTLYDGTADLRLINETFFSDWGYFETHYEVILTGGDSRRQRKELQDFFPDFPEQSLFLGAPLDDDRRLMNLTWTLREDDNYILFHRFDRLYLAYLPPWGSIKIGRQAITWGNGLLFNPMDLFNPFAPTQIDRDYKTGDDMVNAQFAYPKLGDVQLLYVIRRDPDDNEVKMSESSLAGKFHFAAGTTEFDIMGSKHYEDVVTGIGSTGYLGDAAWRLDAAWTFLNDPSDESPDSYLSLVANMDYSWIWWKKNFYGFIEYYHSGLGESDYAKALFNPDITERLTRGELFVLGRNYLSGTLQVELHPLFSIFFTAINNIEDPSGILQPRATWDIKQNLQMTFGANVFYGAKGTEYGGFTVPGTDIRSRSPDNVYLWLIYYY